MDQWNKKQVNIFISFFDILFLLDGIEADFIIPLYKKQKDHANYWNLIIPNYTSLTLYWILSHFFAITKHYIQGIDSMVVLFN